MQRLQGVPKKFIKELGALGLPMSTAGIGHSNAEIQAGSPLYARFVEMLHTLPPIEVDILLDLSDSPLSGGEESDDEADESAHFMELMNYLPNVNPGHRPLRNRGVRGEARSIIEAVVQLVEDPPESCPQARAVPVGVYMLTVQVHFSNLILFIRVRRKAATMEPRHTAHITRLTRI